MTAEQLKVLDWLIPALETFSRPRLDPVVYTYRAPHGFAFHVTNEQACLYAAELLRAVQQKEKN